MAIKNNTVNQTIYKRALSLEEQQRLRDAALARQTVQKASQYQTPAAARQTATPGAQTARPSILPGTGQPAAASTLPGTGQTPEMEYLQSYGASKPKAAAAAPAASAALAAKTNGVSTTKSGNIYYVNQKNQAAENSPMYAGSLHGSFRSTDGNVYDYETAPDEVLWKHGLVRVYYNLPDGSRKAYVQQADISFPGAAMSAYTSGNEKVGDQLTELRDQLKPYRDYIVQQNEEGRPEEDYLTWLYGGGEGSAPDGGGTPGEPAGGNPDGNPMNPEGVTGNGGGGTPEGTQEQAANPYQAAIDLFDYGTPPEWEGTEYERLRDEALQKARDMEWNYDPDADPVWQAYQKQYRREGDRATQNALAQAARRTGGQVSSYAATAASQAGNYYASQLSDRLPEMYQNAYNRYLQEFQRQLGISDAYAGLGRTEYSRYLDRLGQFNTDRNFQHTVNREQVEDEYRARRDAIEDERYDQQWAQQLREYADSQNWKATEWAQYLREYEDQLSERERQWVYQQEQDAYRREQDAMDREYQNRLFEYEQDQDAQDRAYKDRLFEYEQEQNARDDEYRDSVYADTLRRQDYDDAFSRWKSFGYIRSEADAEILGYPVGTPFNEDLAAGDGGGAAYSGSGSGSGTGKGSGGGYTYSGSESGSGTGSDEGETALSDSGMGSEYVKGVYHTDGSKMTKGFQKWWPIIRDSFDQGATRSEIERAVDRLVSENVIASYERKVILSKLGLSGTDSGLNTTWRSR